MNQLDPGGQQLRRIPPADVLGTALWLAGQGSLARADHAPG